MQLQYPPKRRRHQPLMDSVPLLQIDEDITIVYHHGGSFVAKPNGSLVYDNDYTNELTGLDEDLLDVFSLRNYYKVLGFDNMVECWWVILGRPMKSELRALSHDKELVEMCFYTNNNEGRVHIYYEHGVFQPIEFSILTFA
ncbi:hypothetical protein S83_008815 [Arachis hypogaea]